MPINILYDSDMFQYDVDAYVIPVNCFGVMGAGVAKEAKEKFPEASEFYQLACKKSILNIGRLIVYKEGDKHLIFFPTKFHWKNPSYLGYIQKGLQELKRYLLAEQYKDIKILAIPALGCGKGGLKWEEVNDLIGHVLGGLVDHEIYLFAPHLEDESV